MIYHSKQAKCCGLSYVQWVEMWGDSSMSWDVR
jgi:hypothetical protein